MSDNKPCYSVCKKCIIDETGFWSSAIDDRMKGTNKLRFPQGGCVVCPSRIVSSYCHVVAKKLEKDIDPLLHVSVNVRNFVVVFKDTDKFPPWCSHNR